MAPFVGSLEQLAECANTARANSEWHFYLLGFAYLSAQARSKYGEFRCGSRYWNLDLRPRARTAPHSNPPDLIYNHVSLGPGMLASALRLHWLCAYFFMLNGMVYVAGLVLGGGWRSLLPRRTDVLDALKMFRYYIGFLFAKLIRRKWLHPGFNTKYNTLQRSHSSEWSASSARRLQRNLPQRADDPKGRDSNLIVSIEECMHLFMKKLLCSNFPGNCWL